MVEPIRLGGVEGVPIAVAVFGAAIHRPSDSFVGVTVGIGERVVPVAGFASDRIAHGVLLLFLVVGCLLNS